MSPLLEFTKITDARANFKEMYDSAGRHLSAVVSRESDAPVVVVRKDDHKRALRAMCPIDPQVRFADDGRVSMWIDRLPISAEGSDFESAGAQLIEALREYAVTWVEDLRRFPNHEENWGLANLVLLSDDDELHIHLFGED